MPGRAWCSSPSMRSSSRASARSAERPSSGEVPAWAGTPCAVTVTQQPALREVTIAPDSRPHSRQSAASAPCMVVSVNGATLRLSSSGTECSSTRDAAVCEALERSQADQHPALHVGDAGPQGALALEPQRAAARRYPSERRCRDERAAGSAGLRWPGCRATTCRPTGEGTRSTAQPAAAAHSAITVAQASSPSQVAGRRVDRAQPAQALEIRRWGAAALAGA